MNHNNQLSKSIVKLIKIFKKNKKKVNIKNFCYENKNPLIKFYFNNLLKSSINITKLNKTKNKVILDFGCNCQQLKKIIKNKNIQYIGYDIDKKYTDIEDYTKIRPDYIFCINVLEHLTEKELQQTLDNFRKMNSNSKIISATPNMNFLSNFLNGITQEMQWENEEYDIHKSEFKNIQHILKKNCKLIKSKQYMFIQSIQLWSFK